ncbi:hypothetical protein Tsubulata_009084 [Turnera subulata]|uniref:S phase cyclin A-associated protein in the endoplasmic reticulum N-terminal domain-containing protein n=1 Tax=Turnera subulata TaxID=218843 RepID=A0A9Q0JI24_9ROSI|nr:hypothetical protein Tsubulata_009084 [Turnera subulata]
MENNGEAVDDQGSGWLEVKKKHRSGAKFSLQNWAGRFSGRTGSAYQRSEKSGYLHAKRKPANAKGGPNISILGFGNAAPSTSSVNEVENTVLSLDKSVVKEDSPVGGCPKLSQLFVADSTVSNAQKLLQKDITDGVPKIKWGDLEDDVLVRHHDNSQGGSKLVDDRERNFLGRNSENSSTNLQINKLAATCVDGGICHDQTIPLTSKKDRIEEKCKELSKLSSCGEDVSVMKVKMIDSNDVPNCTELHSNNFNQIEDESLISSHKSGEDGIVVNSQVHCVMLGVNDPTSFEVSRTNRDAEVSKQDSESSFPEVIEPEVPKEIEPESSKVLITDTDLDTLVMPPEGELLLPEKSVPDVSRESGILLKPHLPVIPKVNESRSSEKLVTNRDLSTPAVTQNNEPPEPEKGGPENSGEPTVIVSVQKCGNLLDGTMSDELLKVQSVGSFGEGDASESKERFRERLWCFLFENLNRAVDELYLLCELECDLEQMKEAILVLEEAASDFKELTTRVQGFEKVKRSPSQSIDGAPVVLKSDHRRPHALSWEVRRMTTSPHRAEILSSSLEAFQKIQQERANMLAANSAKSMGLQCLNKLTGKSDSIPNVSNSIPRPRKQSGESDICNKRSVDSGRTSKMSIVQPGQDTRHSLTSSNTYLSRQQSSDNSAASGSGKSRRESEAEKLPRRKDKTWTETTMEKNSKPADHLHRQIHLSDKDKEKRHSTSWKSMDAWKEKRNWEDILSSPFRVSSRISHSPGMSRKSAERARILHDKLMSPEKKKKTALDLKKEAEEKHARALRIRSDLENERVQKLQRTSEKLNRVNEWQAVRTMKLREGMYARHQRSESRHEAFLAQVVRRAGDESSKVNEVRFITSLNEENKKLMLRQKHHDSELRRAEKLQVIKTKQKEDMAREEAVLERRKLIEAEKLQRLAETQRKKEEAQVRREEERKASSAAREARAIEQLRRREERAKAQQEEAELLAQKLAERLRESEQRRKFYLEQIRERASMDFRDQSSPLLRRSGNKEGQGRTTPTNSGDDYQENSIAGTGTPAPASGNVTLQHSMKRRIKKIRQRLMALKFDFSEPSASSENTGISYRTAVGMARMKVGRWLQELQRLRQARKEGAASIGLITAEMIKFLEGKDPELQASRQAGLLDFIASALPASHTSKPEACQVTIHLLKLLRVVLSAPANRSYFLAQNLLPPIIPMLSAALENYIKNAASLTVSGSNNTPSSKTLVENSESISEVLDNCLWTVATVVGHTSSDERELQMRDGLVELLIAYQVIHRLRDLFALYDRPQAEGSPFPSSILLSLHLLVVLTHRPETKSSIDWDSSPIKTEIGFQIQEANLVETAYPGDSSLNMTSEDHRPVSVLDGSTVSPLPTSEDKPSDEPCGVNNNDESVPRDGETKYGCSIIELDNSNRDMIPIHDDSQKILIEKKDEKDLVDAVPAQKNIETIGGKQPVAFLLSAISETGLVSLPSLLTAVLLQANNKLSSEQGTYVLPSNFEEVATGVLKVLNNLARLDITFIQRMLARPDLKMEFFHLMSFLLSHCTSKWRMASDQIGLLLLESLLLLGYFALFHSENQAVLRWGKSPTILHKVCDLPFGFFSDPELMPVLAGTLVAACYGCEQNKAVVQQELSMDMLLSLLRSCRTVSPVARLNGAQENLSSEDFCENQPSSELRKYQGETSLKSNRSTAKSTRIFTGRGGAVGSIRGIKSRSQRDLKITKTSEEMASKQNVVASEASTMLHCRFPSRFIDRAEQFFSAELTNVVAEV